MSLISANPAIKKNDISEMIMFGSMNSNGIKGRIRKHMNDRFKVTER